MKKRIAILVLLANITFLSFAQKDIIAFPISNTCTKFSISTFDTVSIIPSNKDSVVISYDRVLHDSIVTSVINDSITLYMNREIKVNNAEKTKLAKAPSSLIIYLTPNKRSLYFYFAPQWHISISPLRCDKLFLDFNASLNANCDIGTVNSIFVKTSSSGNIRIAGKAKYLSLNTEASNDIDLSNLIVDDGLINNNVGMNIHVNVQKNLTLFRNKVSMLKYKGSPKLHYKVSDSVETKNGALEKDQ